MRRRSVLLASAAALCLVAGPALAGDNGYPVAPGVYDPLNLGVVTAEWRTHVGLPDAGKSDHALFLEKAAPTPTLAAAGADLKNVEGTTVPPTVSFWIPQDGDDSYCGAGAPRWNIYTSDGVLHFLGCDAADDDGTAVDSRGRTWVKKTWTTDSAQSIPPIATGSTASIVQIIFDEEGSVLIDDINYIHTMGKPGNGDKKPSTAVAP